MKVLVDAEALRELLNGVRDDCSVHSYVYAAAIKLNAGALNVERVGKDLTPDELYAVRP